MYTLIITDNRGRTIKTRSHLQSRVSATMLYEDLASRNELPSRAVACKIVDPDGNRETICDTLCPPRNNIC